MLEIKNLSAKIESKQILKGLNLRVRPGEIHAIMGPNGAGKSTLAKVLAGHPTYEVTEGELLFKGEELAGARSSRTCPCRSFHEFSIPCRNPGRQQHRIFTRSL